MSLATVKTHLPVTKFLTRSFLVSTKSNTPLSNQDWSNISGKPAGVHICNEANNRVNTA